MKILLAVFVFTIALLSSCSKNDPISTATPAKQISRTELLTNNSNKDWEIISARLNSIESLQNCEKDNTYTFSINGSSTIDFGFTKCDTSEKKTENRTWEFIDKEKRMEWVSPTDTFHLSIENIDNEELKLVQNSTFNGNPIRLVLTFKAK